MGANLLFRHADAIYKSLDFAELQGGEPKAPADFLYHPLIFRSAGGGVASEGLGRNILSLEITYNLPRDQLHIAFWACESDKRATVDQRRAWYAGMHPFGSRLKECAYIVAQLGAAHNGVVAEHYILVLQDCRIRDELHAGYKVAPRLVAGGEAAGPCGGIFQHGTLIGDAVAVGIAKSVAYTWVGDAAHAVGLGSVFLAHNASGLFTHMLHVDSLVGACRETVVHPQEGAYLAACGSFLKHLDAVGREAHDFAGPYIAQLLVVKVGEWRWFAGGGICAGFVPQHNGGASEVVAGGDDAVICQNQHRARAFDFLVDKIDAFHEGLAHVYQQCHQLGLVHPVGWKLAEMHFFCQQLLGYLTYVVDFRHRHHSIPPQMGVYDYRLGIGVAYHPYAGISDKAVELVLELWTEIIAFDAVNHSVEAILPVERHHPGAFCAQVRMIVGAVKNIGHTRLLTDGAKKTSHRNCKNEWEFESAKLRKFRYVGK